MNTFIEIAIEDGVAVLRLNDPRSRNALGDAPTVDAVVLALDQVGADPAVKCIILTGNGTSFCAGGNLGALAAAGTQARVDAAAVREVYNEGIQKIPRAFERLDTPVIAAVNGPAVGAGCDLACMCDIRIASHSASFAESFIKLGIVPGDGGAWFLAKAVGLARAYELSFTGDSIDAKEAQRIGLVSHLVTDEELMPTARTLALRIAKNPRPALRMTKRLIREGVHSRLDSILQMSAAFQALSQQTPEHAELVAELMMRLSAKRNPKVDQP